MNNYFSKVFFVPEISSCALINIYKILKFQFIEKVAIKVHSGESSENYYLSPSLIKPLTDYLNGTIIDANTPYGKNRSTTQLHYKSMKEHGFLDIAPCDIIDEDGSTKINVPNGKRLTTNYVGSHLLNYKSIVVLNHFKGHKTAGYGGVLKDLSIGLASKEGKCWIHTAGKSLTNVNVPTNPSYFFEAMADAARAVQLLDIKFAFISILNNLSADGDGSLLQRKPELPNIGIMASLDPIALEQACIDKIKSVSRYYYKSDCDLIKNINKLNGEYLITASVEQNIGTNFYELININ